MKSSLTLVLSIIALVGVFGVPSAFAQSADWNLTINFTNVPTETDNITVKVYGPFSSTPIQQQTVPTGQNYGNPTVTFSMSSSDVPSGYSYRVCAGATAIGTIFPPCERFTADGNDQTVEITPS
jgi:hypothetical protein